MTSNGSHIGSFSHSSRFPHFLFHLVPDWSLGQVFETVADYMISSIPMYFLIKVSPPSV
jgi:hypothetical protein